MRKLLPLILGIASVCWVVGGTVWYKHNFCDAPVQQADAPVVAIKEGSATVSRSTPLIFPFADARPTFFSESFLTLKKTADYLKDNVGKALIIKGLYSTKEKTQAPNQDLGLQRAESLKDVLITLGAPNDVISTESFKSDNLHFVNNQLLDGIDYTIIDNPNIQFQALNMFFKTKKYRFAESAELSDYFKKLKQYVEVHPSERIKISAHADNTEGSRLARKRLAFIQSFLNKKEIDLKHFEFENKSPRRHKALELPMSQSIQIRLIN